MGTFIWVVYLTSFIARVSRSLSVCHGFSIARFYSTGIQFLHQTTGRLLVPGCTNTVETPTDYMSKNMPSTSMTRVACELKLHSVMTSSMHL